MRKLSGRTYWYTFSAVLTVLLLGIAFWLTDISIVFSVLSSLGLPGVSIAALVYVGGIALRTARFSVLVRGGFWKNFSPLFGIVCIHQFYNHLLPARLGELSFPLLLKKRMKVDTHDSTGFLLIARFYDGLTLGIVVLLGVIFYAVLHQNPESSDIQYTQIIVGTIAFILLVCVSYGVFFYINFSRFAFLDKKNRAGRLLEKLVSILDRTRETMRRHYGFRSNLALFVISSGIWVTLSLFFYVIFIGCGVEMSFSEVIVGSSLSHVTQFLPVNTFGSFGSLEAGWTVGFSLIGIKVDVALGVGIAMHLLTMVVLAVLAALSLFFGRTRVARVEL